MGKIKYRLLHITHDLQIGGLQQVIVNLCKYTDRSQFDISVLCLRKRGIYAEDVERLGIPVYLLTQKKKGVDYFSFLKVSQFLRAENIDIIHSHNTQPLIDGVLAALLDRRIKTIIHTDHARSFPDKKRYMFAEWLLSHFVNKMVGVSEHTSENLIKYEKIVPGKVITIYNGVDPRQFNVQLNRENFLKELGVDPNGPVVGLGVRLTAQKGITYLLKAMPIILKAFPDLSLVIAGEGELETDLKNESRGLGISKNVFFLGPRLDMPLLLKVFDLYVLPSVWEGLPMVLLEAMAAGCPIVATNVGGNSIAIRHGVNGILVPQQNPAALANSIVDLLSNSTLMDKYSQSSLDIFEKTFSAEIMAQKYQKLYMRMI